MPELPPAADSGTNYTAVIATSAGDIRLELWADKAPQTVANFVYLAATASTTASSSTASSPTS